MSWWPKVNFLEAALLKVKFFNFCRLSKNLSKKATKQSDEVLKIRQALKNIARSLIPKIKKKISLSWMYSSLTKVIIIKWKICQNK